MNALTPAQRRELEAAIALLEQPRLAVRVANYVGKPIDSAMTLIPGVSGTVHEVLREAILQCLLVAIESQEGEVFAPSSWRARMLTGLSGGIGGLFGAVALPVELPLTMTIMLRAIADIARDNGEDLRQVEPRLACLQVFALGGRRPDAGVAIGYYAARATLIKLTSDVMATLVERTVLDASTPVIARLVAQIVSRLGIVLSERAAAGAVPILGALGGATLNVMFMDHFERLARGHFTVRRLERTHGRELIQEHYKLVASEPGRRSRAR